MFRIQRGLCGYVSYLAACEMNEAFSEYVLYEPALRILTARGFTVKCEVVCPGMPYAGTGDYKKLDFDAEGKGYRFAIEMKWATERRIDVTNDCAKLDAYKAAYPAAKAFLCVFGRNSDVSEIQIATPGLDPFGMFVVADLAKTRYACRIYEWSAAVVA